MIMGKYTKYRLYQKYETRGSQEAIPCYPSSFSIDGDGTMPLVIVEEDSRECGYTGETQPIYRWYTLPIESYYVCDACQDAQYRWVNIPIAEDWECVGTTKYYKQKKQVSVDGAVTWVDVTPPEYQRGSVYEYSSQGCGYRTRTTTGSPYCVQYDKYVNVYTETSSDGGSTWITASTTPTLVEHNSQDCGYVPPVYENQYLTLVAKGNGAFIKVGHSDTFQYSKNNGSTWTNATSATTIYVSNGDRVMFKGTLIPKSSGVGRGVGQLSANTTFEVEGNPMSLLYGDNFIGQTSLSGKDYAFFGLFNYCSGLTSISNLSLPATTLASYCYYGMFMYCTSLTSIPSGLLPATTLEESCYTSMFGGTAITSIPSGLLPATTLASNCYDMMFEECSSLSSIPNGLLPATTLENYCYQRMFAGCTSLASVPSTLLDATSLKEGCYEYMFSGCTSLSSAPALPATTLVEYCYELMFYSCTNLKYIKCLATNISANHCTTGWVNGVSSSGTFVKASSTNWGSCGISKIPCNWTVLNA